MCVCVCVCVCVLLFFGGGAVESSLNASDSRVNGRTRVAGEIAFFFGLPSECSLLFSLWNGRLGWVIKFFSACKDFTKLGKICYGRSHTLMAIFLKPFATL